ncbi:hypothetical protein Pmani_012105 [Petrolisthes manimaculis]|uniref:XPG-I domain-containing protein n=1 Tax=Petrolisthes manimaculis TaxID=1843537 RepID=A0AAE1UEZ7_9EUCA|nr:hypothetical protein Pmani_012105 [Petrolisthes manimaculis]
MGVRGLWGMVRQGEERVKLSELHGCVLALDTLTWYCAGGIKPLFYRLRNLVKAGVIPLAVLERNTQPWKKVVVKQRKLYRITYKDGGSEAQKKARLKKTTPRRKYSDIQEVCRALGIPFIFTEGEAEKMCACLNAAGVVDGVISEDSDALLYGASVVYRQFSTVPEGRITRVLMARVQEMCGLRRASLAAYAVLVGCDMLPGGAEGVGVATANKIIKSDPVRNERELKRLLKQHFARHEMYQVKKVIKEFYERPVMRSCYCVSLCKPNPVALKAVTTKIWGNDSTETPTLNKEMEEPERKD